MILMAEKGMPILTEAIKTEPFGRRGERRPGGTSGDVRALI